MAAPSRDIIRLANLMIKKKKTEGTAPFVLVLGSGAAPVSIEKIEVEVLKVEGMTEQEIKQLRPAEKTDLFKRAWDRLQGDTDARFACIAELFTSQMNQWEYQQKQEGYLGLARLIKYGYFDVVLTTNTDTALEDTLARIGLTRGDYRFLMNGVDSAEQIRREIGYRVPRIKIIKLHGDLYSRVFAFSYREVFRFSQKVEAILENYLAGSVLMVGKSSIDEDINRCIPADGGNFYYVNIDPPKPGTPIYNATQVRESTIISGEHADFSSFFLSLNQQLLNFESYSEVGVDITKISDEQAEAASQSDEPLVELLGEENLESSQATATEVSLVDLVDSTDFFVDVVETTTFYIRYDGNQRLSFGIEGKLQHESGEGEIISLNPEELNQMLLDMAEALVLSYRSGEEGTQSRASWRRTAQREGKQLYRDLLAGNSSLMEKLGFARQAAGSEDNLNLCFVGPRNHLGMPYELLYDTAPWAVRYPLCRQVTGVTTNKQSFNQAIGDLIRVKQPLKILLIASGTAGISADREINALAESIQQKADAIKLLVEIEKIPTATASVRRVEQLLEKCSYHIVHFAGHSKFDAATGENSELIFYQHPKNRSGEDVLTARTLFTLLRDSQTILFYLSSCVGATVAGQKVLGKDCLGIMDAIVQAGIPTVFGYRWYVTDSGAQRFASQFYESLLATRSPNRAVLKARQVIYNQAGDDETWLSPILVVQNL